MADSYAAYCDEIRPRGRYADAHVTDDGRVCGRSISYVGEVETVNYDWTCAKCLDECEAADEIA